MKVLLLSRYGSLGASSRVRYLQYLPYFREQGVEVTVIPLFSNSYLEALYQGGSRWYEVLSGYGRRCLALFRVRKFDAVIVEKEFFPFFPAIAERLLSALGVTYIVDYDDALFHRYDCHSSALVRRLLGRKIDVVMRNSSIVVAGNDYLAERARQAGAARVEIVPTVVDTDRYQTRQGMTNDIPIVGWIGTPETSRYLKALIPVFEELQKAHKVRFVAVGASEEAFNNTPVEVWSWSEETEVASIQKFDIGIMPLTDTPWERGKCGYKLIQYMACGLPVVASPVGVNSQIILHQESGFLAETPGEWKKALQSLLEAGLSSRETMGRVGRARAEQWYSLKKQAPELLQAVREGLLKNYKSL